MSERMLLIHFPVLGPICQPEESSKSSLCLTLCLGLWAETFCSEISWTPWTFSHELCFPTLSWFFHLFFPELFDYSISVLDCGHQSWTQYFTSHSVFAHSEVAFIHLAEHLTQMHVQLKTPWFPPVLFRLSSALNSVVAVCWSLCWLIVLVPKTIQSPLYCRLCLLIIQPLL